MFERIKCYKNLKKQEKLIRGIRKLGEIDQDDELIRLANEALYNNKLLEKRMWFNRKLAEKFNLEILRHGFLPEKKGKSK